MKKLLLIVLILTGCSSPESKIESIVKKQLKKYPAAKLEGLEVKVYKDAPSQLYADIARAESKELEFAMSLSSKAEQDSITSSIDRYSNLMKSADDKATFYLATAVVMKSDTALYNKYYFDDKMNLLYEDRIK